jgi:hypothetical protein
MTIKSTNIVDLSDFSREWLIFLATGSVLTGIVDKIHDKSGAGGL